MKDNLQNYSYLLPQILGWLRQPFANNSASLSCVFALGLIVGLGCVCSTSDNENRSSKRKSDKIEIVADPGNKEKSKSKTSENTELPRRVEHYEIKGFAFSYYLIPPGLNRAELIKTAQKLHDDEPNTNLILVDDESGLADYVEYAKAASKGNMEAEMPKEWADKHIVGNVQKWMSGEWFLCESNGYEKIAALE